MCNPLIALPQDAIDDVLFRLSVKSIARFRCVSKQWRSYLLNPRFAKFHLESLKTKNPENLLCIADHSLNVVNFAKLKSITTGTDGSTKDVWRKVNFPFDFKVGSSCHGLILLVGKDYKSLMNPMTLEYDVVQDDSLYDRFIVYGLGYDYSKDDYKIVSFTGGNRCGRSRSVDIYSFKTKTWRSRLSNFGSVHNHLVYELDASKDRYEGLYVNSCLHWVAACSTGTARARHLMMSFNFAREKFEEVAPPRDVELGCVEIKVLGGYLAFMVQNYNRMDVWLMKDYSVRDSWTKLAFHSPNYSISDVALLLNDHELVVRKLGDGFLVIDSRTGISKMWEDIGGRYYYMYESLRALLGRALCLPIS